MSKLKTLECTYIIPKFYSGEFGTKDNILQKSIFKNIFRKIWLFLTYKNKFLSFTLYSDKLGPPIKYEFVTINLIILEVPFKLFFINFKLLIFFNIEILFMN